MKRSELPKYCPPLWGKTEIPTSPPPFTSDSGVPQFIKDMDNITPYKLFQQFFSDEFILHLVFQTNLYAEQKQIASGKSYTRTNEREIRAFLGINLLMGIKRMPSYKDYWSSCPELHDSFISSIMTVKRFGWLLGNIHINDNSLIPDRSSPNFDKLYKVRPLLEHLSNKFAQCLLPSKEVAIDESMIKFKGRSSLKQYMPKKPIKRGYKVWMLCDKSGYCLKFDVYTGKAEDGNKVGDGGLGSRVVNKLVEGLDRKNHRLYFDNFFNNVEMMENLKEKEIFSVGTVNPSRKFLPKFKPDKELKRGEYEWFSSNSGLLTLKWKDKRCVHLLSNHHSPEDTTEVKRKDKSGDVVAVPCPTALTDYNANMNNVDKFDQLLASYKIDRQSNKWWHRIFFYFLDASVVNAFCLYKLLNLPKLSSKDFRRNISNGLVANKIIARKRSQDEYQTTEIKKHKRIVPETIRLTSSDHQPERSTRKRCAHCSTKKEQVRTNWICTICQVPLCLGKEKTCFQQYHSK